MKRLKVATAITLMVTLLAMTLTITSCIKPATSVESSTEAYLEKQDYLEKQYIKIMYMLHALGGTKFRNEFTFIEKTDASGMPYYVGALSDDLAAILDEMIARYNADPATDSPVTTEEVRYWLTDGIAKAADDYPHNNPAPAKFVSWTAQDADLVYKEDVSRSDGRFIPKGTAVENPPSNYEYITNKENPESMCSYFECRSDQATR